MANSVKTQGTHLYFVDRTGTAALVKLTCPTGITGLTGGAADTIDTTYLDETDTRTYARGLNAATAVSVPFVLDPGDDSHQLLFTLKETGDVLNWIALLSDGTAAPTLLTENIVPPTTRTSFTFDGYISEVSVDIGGNDVVRGTLTIQRSGPAVPHWKA